MEDYKKEFIDFMVECNALKFGSFTLKSGRKSPFFMNAGAYVTGGQLKRLGEAFIISSRFAIASVFSILEMILTYFLDRLTKEFRSL